MTALTEPDTPAVFHDVPCHATMCSAREVSNHTDGVLHPNIIPSMVNNMDTLAELRQTVQELATHDTQRATLMNRRDDLVLKALTEGARWSQIEHLPGLSRRSIQKIREKRGVARTTE